MKITIVEDQKLYRNSLKQVIEKLAKEVYINEAENGKQFLEQLPENKPDLVFMDIEMPVMNGIQATHEALKIFPDLRIIGLSMYEADQYIRKIIDAGASGYLLKTGDNIQTLDEILNHGTNGFVYSPEINFHQPLLQLENEILLVESVEGKYYNLTYNLIKTGFKVSKTIYPEKILSTLIDKHFDLLMIDIECLISVEDADLLVFLKQSINPELKIYIINNLNSELSEKYKKHQAISGYINKETNFEEMIDKLIDSVSVE